MIRFWAFMLQFPCVVFFLFFGPFASPFSCCIWPHCSYPHCLHVCLFDSGCVSSRTPQSLPVFAHDLCVCVCSSIISCTARLSLPPHCSASLPVLGVWNRSLQEISSLVVQKGKQTARCTNTGRAASLTWAPAGHLSLLCVYHNAET